ncbi:patatin-like phospholipase family protein [Paenibacillus sp. SC116]|uniref:patatin-like phospholipase family protein n=1 Tax=Paenibacillus sp. SC116 TaxID=2968986 RepID=UPI002812465D|nr:patatin-like phospholipase family protein [Paenibacillus sp. SC116]
MHYPFRNLVFEGGGIKGLAYVGALETLDNKNVLSGIQRIAGTSAGAITAVLVALNYSLDEIRDIQLKLDLRKFQDDSWGALRDTARMLTEYGWYKGDIFRKWIGDLVQAKTGSKDSTFEDIWNLKQDKGFRDLFLIGTNLSTRLYEVFSYQHTPTMKLTDAARISMSIPLYFRAIRNDHNDVYVDGGVLNNYPIRVFDKKKYVEREENFSMPSYYERANSTFIKDDDASEALISNQETLGFRLDTSEQISMFRDHKNPQHREIHDFFDYTHALIETIRDFQSNQHLYDEDWRRTVYVDTLDVKTTDFDITDEEKKALIHSGRTFTEKYFQWFDNERTQ